MLKESEPSSQPVTVLEYSWDTAPRQPSLPALQRMQEELAKYPQIDLQPEHYFAPGMYGRALPIPTDSYVVGKIHRHQHITMLISGEATINTDKGMQRIRAPHIWISQANAKRALHTHTDCLFFTVHLNPTDTHDLDAIEDYVIVPEPAIAHEAHQLPEFADELQGVFA